METKTPASFFRQNKTWNFLSDLIQASALVWKAHPGYTYLIAIFTILQGVLPMSQLWISKVLIDTVVSVIQGGADKGDAILSTLVLLIGAQAGLFLLSTLLSAGQETFRPLLGDLLNNQINLMILNKTNGLDISFFENEKFYNKLQNAYQEANHRPIEIVFQIFTLVQTIITLSSMILLLLRLNCVILPLILVSTFPILIVQRRYGFLNYWMLHERVPELRKQSYFSMVLTSNWFIKEIRVFHLEDYFLNLYKLLFGKFYNENRKLTMKRNVGITLASIGSILGWFLAAAYVVSRVIARTITIGDFTMYSQAILATQTQIQVFLIGLGGLYSNSLFLSNLFEFLSLPARNLTAGKAWTDAINEIEFRDVSFSYPGKNRIALDKISFKISRGQSIALVGKNGAGKTTLVKLLCRLYEPTSGEILINGEKISDYSPSSVQEYLAVLFQDYGNYYLTARENIGIGRVSHHMDITKIKAAAKRSGANIVIEALHDKYDTMLGKWFDEGIDLSGGEWQKVALARGFFRQGSVLILDEPTASLDAEAEFDVFRNLTENKADQITLLISHRFSTVRMADYILVLEGGKCIEAGSHDELMAIDGHYSYLFRLQALGYENKGELLKQQLI